MPAGSLTLADVAGRTADLAVACTRCDRAERYHMANLIARHGSVFPVPELLRLLSADCPKRASVTPTICAAPISRSFLACFGNVECLEPGNHTLDARRLDDIRINGTREKT